MPDQPSPTPNPTPPPMAPRPSGPSPVTNRLLAIALAILGVFALFIVGALILARQVAHRFAVKEKGDRVTLQTPVGDLNLDKSGKTNPGLPVYPGAEQDPDEKGVAVDIPFSEGYKVVVAQYETDDDRDSVDEWYKRHLPSDFEREIGSEVHEKKPGMDVKKDDIAYVSERGDHVRLVVLGKKEGGTTIKLLRIGSSEAQ